METKWTEILNKCLQNSLFSDWISKPPKWDALETAFNRWTKAVLKQYGISEEGANLSGLENEPSEFVKLIISMAEDKEQEAKEREEKKKKEEQKAVAIFTHESSQLNKQTKLNPTAVTTKTQQESPAVEDTASIITVKSESSKRGKAPLNPFANLENIFKEDDRLIDLTVEQRAEEINHLKRRNVQELEQQDRKFQAEVEHESKRLAMEERRLAMDERRLAMEEKRLEDSARMQATTNMLLEFLMSQRK